MDTPERGFPVELLQGSVKEREAHFRARRIAHYRLQDALDHILTIIHHPCAGQIVLVFGPTGVGKTTLCHRVHRQILMDEATEMQADPGYLPVGHMELLAPETGSYSWKGHWIGALTALHEPMIDAKIDYSSAFRKGPNGKVLVDRNADTATLRAATEEGVRNRRTKAFLLDEGPHLLKGISGGAKLLTQMDILKSFTNRTGTVLVLFGTYEMLALLDLSDQLIRRSDKIQLPRYNIGDEFDLDQFLAVLGTFQAALPLHDEPDLLSDYDYIYEGCLGVIGLLKEWLDRALVRALYAESSDDTVLRSQSFQDHMRATVLSDGELIKIVARINEGEQVIRARSNRRAELRALIDLANEQDRKEQALLLSENQTSQDISLENPGSATSAKPDSKKANKRKPGVRNPSRDTAGKGKATDAA